MGLFDKKKTTFYDSQPYYTIGNERTILVIGLGNPGKKYAANRHNAGFMAADKYHSTQDFSSWSEKKDMQAMVATGQVGSTKIILAKPMTFMNESGNAVQKLQKYYRIYNTETIVLYDELDVKFGTIRTRIGGGSAGHNGIKSITQHIDKDYGRIRIGIGPKKPNEIDSADFVLKDFAKKDQELMPKILTEVASLIDEATAGDLTEQTVTV